MGKKQRSRKSVFSNYLAPTVLVVVMLFFQNCGGIAPLDGRLIRKGTSTGDPSQPEPSVQLTLSPYQNPDIPIDLQIVRDLQLCIEKLEFKTLQNHNSEEDDEFEFQPGSVLIAPGGVTIPGVQVHSGLYEEIRFVLSTSRCPGGNSVQFGNPYGSFSTQKRIELRFQGDFKIDQISSGIDLAMGEIIDALSEVNSNEQIPFVLQSVVQNFSK